MGDPKKIRKKYTTPRHPWIGSRIEEERQLRREYGLRNKQEIWKMDTQLTQFKDRAKRLLARTDSQAQKEAKQLIERTVKLGLLKEGATFDDILGLNIKNMMERRLQTLLIKKLLARTPKQARQMITHRHVSLGGKVITSPGYIVSVDQESTIAFVGRSAFISEAHPERFSEEELLRKKQKEEAKKQKVKSGEVVDAATFDPAAIEQAEVLSGEKKVESVKDAVAETEKAVKESAKKAEGKKTAPKTAKKEETPETKVVEKAEAAPEKKAEEEKETPAPEKEEQPTPKEEAKPAPKPKKEDDA